MQKYAIGIDLGGTNTRIALVAFGGRIISRQQFQTRACKDREGLLSAIVDNVEDIIGRNRINRRDIAGLGIGVPGLVDFKKGVVYSLTNVPGWRNVELKKILEDKTGFKVCVDNDVNLMALAECRFGAARGLKYVFCVTLGTGLGGGIVIDKEVYRGGAYSAGEIGHISIDAGGPKCKCGGRGCVETYVGSSYLVRDAVSRIKNGQASAIKTLVMGRLDKITPAIITKAAKKGDSLAKGLWRDTALRLARALVMVVNVFNPQIIVIGGGMAGAGKFLFQPLSEYIRENALPVPAKAVMIVKAMLGNDAGVIGAAELARVNEKY